MLLVLCPLKPELKFLRKALEKKNLSFKPSANQRYFTSNHNLVVAKAGHGKVNFALSTFDLVTELKPQLVICAGAAGGIGQQLKHLDIVVATETIEHDYKQKFSPQELPSFPGHLTALQHLTHLKQGIIASGDEDIITSERKTEILKQTHATAVAWEGAGGAKACQKTQTPFLEMRFISDLCDDQAYQDFSKNLEKGMELLAHEILELSQHIA